MPDTQSRTERHIQIAPVNDIRTCGQLKNRLTECLSGGGTLVLDADSFQSGDITFVQTLISAAKTAEKWGVRMEITNAPPAFAALLERCGLGAQPHALHFRPPRTQ